MSSTTATRVSPQQLQQWLFPHNYSRPTIHLIDHTATQCNILQRNATHCNTLTPWTSATTYSTVAPPEHAVETALLHEPLYYTWGTIKSNNLQHTAIYCNTWPRLKPLYYMCYTYFNCMHMQVISSLMIVCACEPLYNWCAAVGCRPTVARAACNHYMRHCCNDDAMISHTIIACAIVGASNERKQENHCTQLLRMSCNTPFLAHAMIAMIAHMIIACVTVGACAATHAALAHELHAMSVLQYCMQYTCNECVAVLHAIWMQCVCCSAACNAHELHAMGVLQYCMQSAWAACNEGVEVLHAMRTNCYNECVAVLHAMSNMRLSCVQSLAWLLAWLYHKDSLSLQHTQTLNTLHHTPPHGNTRQHTATHLLAAQLQITDLYDYVIKTVSLSHFLSFSPPYFLSFFLSLFLSFSLFLFFSCSLSLFVSFSL